MITAKIKDKDYLIPQSWDDITFKQGVDYYILRQSESKTQQVVLLLTGIEPDILNKLSKRSVNNLEQLLSFTKDSSIFDSVEVKEAYKDFDFGAIEYGQEQKIKQLINNEKSLIENAIPAFNFLFQIKLEEESFTEWIGTVNFFLNSWFSSMMSSDICLIQNERNNKNKQGLTGLNDSGILVLT